MTVYHRVSDDYHVRIAENRESRLNAAFDSFDLDGSGKLSEDEFFEIGKVPAMFDSSVPQPQVMQAMHPGGAWTTEKNKKTLLKLDENQ